MGYYTELTITKVVCRNPESVTTADRFAMVCATMTDPGSVRYSDSKGVFLSELRLLRKNEYATFNETFFIGDLANARIGLVFRAWDKDLNSAWVDTKEDIEKIKDGIKEGLDKVPVVDDVAGGILEFAADYLLTAVDVFVQSDLDDELVNYQQWIDLSDASFEPRTREIEIKFSRSDPSGYSDWDYSVFFGVSYYQTPPSFGPKRPLTWEPHMSSTVADWVGVWVSGEVECRITPSIYPKRVNVSVTETVNSVPTTTETKHVPISKVFMTAGYRELE